jgi:TIR domain
MKVFISHITEEKDLAALLKERIDEDFLGKVECFVSSDTESILAGENWLISVEEALRDASVEIVLCSPASVKRPWINFEDARYSNSPPLSQWPNATRVTIAANRSSIDLGIRTG